MNKSVFDESLPKYKKALEDVFFKEFPHLKPFLEIYYYGNNDNEPLTHAEGRPGAENHLYKATDYFYEKQSNFNYEFIHFTSLKSLLAILHSQVIRLQSLNKMNDPNEINFAADLFQLKPEFIENEKKAILSLSLCEYQSKDPEIAFNTNNLDLWRFYGEDGNGVAIKLKIINHPLHWDSYHMAPIQYGKDSLKEWIKIKTKLDDFKLKYPELYIHFIKLFCFHKNIHYKNEQEVRLIFAAHYDRNKDDLSYSTSSYMNEVCPKIIRKDKYYTNELLLVTTNLTQAQKSYSVKSPQIIIDGIILGYRFKEEELNMYKDIFNATIKQAGGREIENDKIIISELHKYYR
jgi:hypothetical protein